MKKSILYLRKLIEGYVLVCFIKLHPFLILDNYKNIYNNTNNYAVMFKI